MNPLPPTDWDVLIAGAGPAGSTAARILAARGARVLVLEKSRAWPRYKVCGGGLTGRGLRELGLDVGPVIEARPSRLLVHARGRYSFVARTPPGVVMTMRDRLDAFLMEDAVRLGADFRYGSGVTRLHPSREGVTVETTSGRRFSARFLIGADGVHSTVARLAGLAGGKEVFLALEWELDPGPELHRQWLDTMFLDCAIVPHGYGWVFPKKGWLSVGVGGLVRRGGVLEDRLRRMLRILGLRGTVRRRQGYWLSRGGMSLPVQGGPVLLAGDAAGLVDPFLGEGIAWAAASGRLAAETVLAALAGARAPEYQERVEAELLPELRRARRLADWVHRWHRPIFTVLRRRPDLLDPLLDILSGRDPYRGLPGRVRRALFGRRAVRP